MKKISIFGGFPHLYSKVRAVCFSLSRHDLIKKVSASTRRKLESNCDAYRDDEEVMQDLADGLQWERYKHDLVHSILREQQKEFYLVSYTDRFQKSIKKQNSWKP